MQRKIITITAVTPTNTEEELLVRIRELEAANNQAAQENKSLKEENKALIDQNRALEAQLIDTDKKAMLGLMAASIAHDLNNLLTSILGFADISSDYIENLLTLLKPAELNELKNIKDPRKILELLNDIKDNLEAILQISENEANLVKQMLNLGRKNQATIPELITIAPIINDTLKLIKTFLPHNVDIKLNLDCENGFILAEKTAIQQIMMNLFINAGHAMEEHGGTLTISLNEAILDQSFTINYPNIKPGKYVELKVSDTGHGMSEETMARIFEPLFTTKAAGKGTGLGLANVSNI
ncbi:MAG: ATP-binding protein, partial [Candidatus Margulisiibacteriota bacterium]